MKVDSGRTLFDVTDELLEALAPLEFSPPVAHVYNPLLYARPLWDSFLERWGSGPREVVLFGMNPGPWGMVQTGIPFGEVAAVRDWLALGGTIGKPAVEHPKRPVTGLNCPRSEVSGRRVWGWAESRFQTPDKFFQRFFVANYCPLAFLEESGRNFTPDKLRKTERDPLLAACDEALRATVTVLRPKWVVGIGKFALKRATIALGDCDVAIGSIPHPSPASPLANRGWAKLADDGLRDLGVFGG
jgi:single-strand selective monofunctional uracil DNA glycosylase